MTNRMTKLALVLLTTAGMCFGAPQALADIMLKKSIVVEDEFVTFGDVFEGDSLSDDEDVRFVRLARAPDPGKLIQLSPSRVRAFAAKHGLNWRNIERVQRISVKRASDIISLDDIEAAIARAIEQQGVAGKIDVQLPARSAKLHVPKGSRHELVARLDDYDPTRRFFRGQIAAIDDDGNEITQPVSGRAISVATIPVLAQAIAPGGVITEADLNWVDFPADRIAGNMITDASQIIGMSPKRPIRTSFPVRISDVRRPIVAAKGAAVTVLFDSPGISLSISGRAMEDGAQGQLIRIQNLRSNRVVEAEVIGPNKVRAVTNTFAPI